MNDESKMNTDSYKYAICQMSATTAASDALAKYTGKCCPLVLYNTIYSLRREWETHFFPTCKVYKVSGNVNILKVRENFLHWFIAIEMAAILDFRGVYFLQSVYSEMHRSNLLKTKRWFYCRNVAISRSSVYSNCFYLPTDRIRTDATAFNMYGLLLEKQKLYRLAVKAFAWSVSCHLFPSFSGHACMYVCARAFSTYSSSVFAFRFSVLFIPFLHSYHLPYELLSFINILISYKQNYLPYYFVFFSRVALTHFLSIIVNIVVGKVLHISVLLLFLRL